MNGSWRRGDLHSVERVLDDLDELRARNQAAIDGLPLFVIGISMGSIIAQIYAWRPEVTLGHRADRAAIRHSAGHAAAASRRLLADGRPDAATGGAAGASHSTDQPCALVPERAGLGSVVLPRPRAGSRRPELVKALMELEKRTGELRFLS